MSLKLPIFFFCCCVFFASIGDAIFSAFSFSFSALWYAAFCAANFALAFAFAALTGFDEGLGNAGVGNAFFLLSFAFVVAFFAIFFSSSAARSFVAVGLRGNGSGSIKSVVDSGCVSISCKSYVTSTPLDVFFRAEASSVSLNFSIALQDPLSAYTRTQFFTPGTSSRLNVNEIQLSSFASKTSRSNIPSHF